MCDYSLEVYRSRPAQEGESYETYRFASGSIGFIAPGDTAVAVCMASDTRLRLEGLPKSVQRFHGVPYASPTAWRCCCRPSDRV